MDTQSKVFIAEDSIANVRMFEYGGLYRVDVIVTDRDINNTRLLHHHAYEFKSAELATLYYKILCNAYAELY